MPERPKGAACKAVIRGFKSRSALITLSRDRSPRTTRFGGFLASGDTKRSPSEHFV